MTVRDGGAPGLLSRVTPSRAAALRLPPGLMRLGVRQLRWRVLDPGLPWEVSAAASTRRSAVRRCRAARASPGAC